MHFEKLKMLGFAPLIYCEFCLNTSLAFPIEMAHVCVYGFLLLIKEQGKTVS